MSELPVSSFCLNHLVSLSLGGSSWAAASPAHRLSQVFSCPHLQARWKAPVVMLQPACYFTSKAAQSVGTVTNPQILTGEFLKEPTIYRAREAIYTIYRANIDDKRRSTRICPSFSLLRRRWTLAWWKSRGTLLQPANQKLVHIYPYAPRKSNHQLLFEVYPENGTKNIQLLLLRNM